MLVSAAPADDPLRDLANGDVAVRRRALRELEAVDTVAPAAIAPLVQQLRDTDIVVADAAVRLLGRGGPAARVALEALLDTSDPELRARAGQAIGRLAATDPDAWPLVRRGFRDDGIRDKVASGVSK